MGVFLSPDPVNTDPSTGSVFSRYEYASSNPLKLVDPDGRLARRPWERHPWEQNGPSGRFGGTPSFADDFQLGGPTRRPANGKNKHAARDRMLKKAVARYKPETEGAAVEYDPSLRAGGTTIGTSTILLGPSAFGGTLGGVASAIEHEGRHIRQEKRRMGYSTLQLWADEAEAYGLGLQSAESFELSDWEIERTKDLYLRYFNELPADMQESVIERLGGNPLEQ
ncbi:hypothetical protein C6N40_12920 [Arenimonas caeni]|uniref:Uncharacterized protein n=1 Tax=Arenimonas caeni TaxID=2058085 RepID=A0A2P6M646_9GAMM|nr:hypothetical protein C6N40_12920 [Arenimonas caeni]